MANESLFASRAGGCLTVMDGKVFTDPATLHDWRLLSREWFDASVPAKNHSAVGWQETWYCTRCRLVDERRASA